MDAPITPPPTIATSARRTELIGLYSVLGRGPAPDKITPLTEQPSQPEDDLAGAEVLQIIDSRTGARHRIPIENGAIRATELLALRAGPDDPGLSTYDPAYKNTAACVSRITYIDGEKGILRYRGYPIDQIAETATYLEVAWLLLRGELPTAAESAAWAKEIAESREIPSPLPEMLDGFAVGAHPMTMFMALLAGLAAAYPESKQVRDPENRALQIRRLIAKAPVLAAMAHRRNQGLPPVAPRPELSLPENFLNMVFGSDGREPEINPALARAMDVLFVLHADHEQNCSASAMRGVGSSEADPYVSTCAAAAALFGPLHGGANEAVLRMLDEIGTKDRVPAFLESVRSGERRLMGFGHRVYKSYDPRARIIKRTAYEVFDITGRNPKIEIALELERIALQEEYFVKRRLYPNVDFYSGIIYEALGFPKELFTVLFAVPRVSGWLAQWQEMLEDREQKIARPKQLYLGEPERPVPA